MADVPEQISSRLKQFDVPVKNMLAEGGIFIAGVVTGKTAWPAKDGREPSWNVEIGYRFGTSRIQVSQQLFATVVLGSYQLFQVSQRASGKAIYSTALEI